jgi:hypothetical protein
LTLGPIPDTVAPMNREIVLRARGVPGCVLLALSLTACATAAPDPAAVVWTLGDVNRVGAHATEIVGAPKAIGAEPAIAFDGRGDALFVNANPIAGWSAFTIEARFRPDGDGPEEQRFLHVEDGAKRRFLLETRVTPDQRWALDTFLFQDADHKLTLLDRAKLHPTDRWHWVALVYDGRKMSHYVNGVLELEGEVQFAPMSEGRASIGVRQNRVSWFKGAIAELRFTPAALPATQLRK